MANINGIIGMNSSAGSNILLAAYGNDIINVSTGTGYKLNLTAANNVEFEFFLDRVFYQNFAQRPKTFNGTSWSFTLVPKTPISKFIKEFKSRIYLGYTGFSPPQNIQDADTNDITFPFRVMYSDLATGSHRSNTGSNLTWGIEWGLSAKCTIGSPFLDLDQANAPPVSNFVTSNIKQGDPLFITNTSQTLMENSPFFVSSVESPYRLRMTENFPETNSNFSFWVGGNWFDLPDAITGMGKNSDRLLISTLDTFWFYTGTQLRQVKDAKGTSSHRSIISKKGYTYYFHGSDPYYTGIYRYDGVNSVKISRAIDPFILGMNTANYTSVVAWEEGEEIRFFIGDLTNTNYDISMTNAVASLHTVTGAWDVSPISDIITCSTTWKTSNRKDTYCGTSDNQVIQMSDGNSFNTDPITMNIETKAYYPTGTENINKFTTIQVIGRNTKGIRVSYKLWDQPDDIDTKWQSLGICKDDLTELVIPVSHCYASGIQLKFDERGTLENDLYVEKVTIFYEVARRRRL